MEVKRLLVFFIVLQIFILSCSNGKNSNDALAKADATLCSEQVIPGEKLIRWRNGDTTRITDINFDLTNSPQIEFIEDNYKIQLTEPQNILNNTSFYNRQKTWGIESINVKPLWSKEILGKGITVAVIDSGIDTQHPEIRNQLYVNPGEILNGEDDDNNGLIDDINGFDFTMGNGSLSDSTGHGTHVAGIIAADHEVGDVYGVAPKAKILAYDFFGQQGDGSVFSAIQAMKSAQRTGAKVINASWGGNYCSAALREAISDLNEKGVLVVTAAGNERQNIDISPSFPASFDLPNLVTIGASTIEGLTAGFSNTGKSVHIVAPGDNIFSTYPVTQLNDGTIVSGVFQSGTSMSAPFVSGAAAILMSAFPDAKPTAIKTALLNSSKAGPFPVLTRGQLDVSAAYELLLNDSGSNIDNTVSTK